MLDVVPPVVRDGGRGCLYTAEPTDGCPRDSEAVHQSIKKMLMFTFNAIARQSIYAQGCSVPLGRFLNMP